MKLRAVLLASMLSVGTLFAGTYKVDVDHSTVAFKVKHMMISNVNGQFTKFSGTFVYDEKSKTLQSLQGVVDVSSISTDNVKRDGHLKSADFFDLAKFTTITFTLDKVEGDTAYGQLTIHGVTKEIKMALETSGTVVKDPWGAVRKGLSLTGTINRKDFGLNWNKLVEAGGVMVGDDVKIDVELEGVLVK